MEKKNFSYTQTTLSQKQEFVCFFCVFVVVVFLPTEFYVL